jgi:hypothetical protein
VAIFGDSSFFHTTLPAIMNAVHNESDVLMIVLDNGGALTTGSQPHPGVGRDAFGREAPALDMARIARACGVADVRSAGVREGPERLRELFREALSRRVLTLLIVETARPPVGDTLVCTLWETPPTSSDERESSNDRPTPAEARDQTRRRELVQFLQALVAESGTYMEGGRPMLKSGTTALALVLVAGTATATWAQQSGSKASGPQRMQSSPRESPRATPRSSPKATPGSSPRSSPGFTPSSTGRSGSRSRSSLGSSPRGSEGTGLPLSDYGSGPGADRRGRRPSSATVEAGPALGPRFTSRNSDRRAGSSSGSRRDLKRRQSDSYLDFDDLDFGIYGFYGYEYVGKGCWDYAYNPFLHDDEYYYFHPGYYYYLP